MWRRKNDMQFKSKCPRSTSRNDQRKSPLLFQECKKPGHFKFECPYFEMTKENLAFLNKERKKALISTWEDLDFSESNEEYEEFNL